MKNITGKTFVWSGIGLTLVILGIFVASRDCSEMMPSDGKFFRQSVIDSSEGLTRSVNTLLKQPNCNSTVEFNKKILQSYRTEHFVRPSHKLNLGDPVFQDNAGGWSLTFELTDPSFWARCKTNQDNDLRILSSNCTEVIRGLPLQK